MEYLAFVDELGKDSDGQFIYRLDFTEDAEIVWGDYFNVVPAIVVPDLQPEKNCLSSQATMKSPKRLNLAKRNPCFSMQDCIDGIISLCFSDISEDNAFRLDYGITFDETIAILSTTRSIAVFGYQKVEKGDESEIDNLMKKLGEQTDEEDE